MDNFKNKTVLITGGASGIGRIMGKLVLQRGARLVIWDIDQVKLDETVKEFKSIGPVTGFIVNVADQQQIEKSAAMVLREIGPVDVLINNAGIIVGKYFSDHTVQDISRTMDINANAPMFVTQQFLPGMIDRNSGYICNIASSAGLISNPKMSVYVASKWALTGWSDSLRIELRQQNLKIGVTTVTPYYINTGMFDGVKSLIPILKPEKVAEKVIRGIEKNRIFVSMPWSVRFVRLGQAIFPIWFFDWFIGGVMGIYRGMEGFKGRDKIIE
jgi:short-subunit dehydrogenase